MGEGREERGEGYGVGDGEVQGSRIAKRGVLLSSPQSF